MLKYKYIGEVATDENWEHKHRLIIVFAKDSKDALTKIAEEKEEDESIYQISTKFDGYKLAQPVWDFFNEFRVY